MTEALQLAIPTDQTAADATARELPGLLYEWNQQYCRRREAHMEAAQHREEVEARVRIATAKGPTGDYEQGPPWELLDAQVDIHPAVLGARHAEQMAELEMARVAGVLDALRAKRDMLVVLGRGRADAQLLALP